MQASRTQEYDSDPAIFAGSFPQLFDTSPLAVYVCDKDGYIRYYNEAAATLWGRRPALGKDIWCGAWKMYNQLGEPVPGTESAMAKCIECGTAGSKEVVTVERPDHSFSRLLLHTNLLKDSEGSVTGVQNIMVDISQQKDNEQNNSVLSAIVESSDDAIISKNLQGIITSWNKAAQKIFGYTAEEIIGRSINTLIPPHLHGEEQKIIANIRCGKKVDHFRTIRITKSGKLVHVSLTASPVKDANGVIVGASKIARDISEQLQREEALKQSAERMRLLNSIGKTISEKLDVQSILQKVTEATTSITGAAVGAFFYNTVNELGESHTLTSRSGSILDASEGTGLTPDTTPFSQAFNGPGAIRVADVTQAENNGKNTTARVMPAGFLEVRSYLAVPVISNSGALIGGLFLGHPDAGVFTTEDEEVVSSIASQAAVALDNSQLFEQVSALNKRKDEFIALASHELKTPMTTIKGYLQILQKKEEDTVKAMFLGKCVNQVNQLSKLVGNLFDISRIEAGKLQLTCEEFDLRELVKSIVETFQYSQPSHRLELICPDQNLRVYADKPKIEQVLSNIVNNAIKYSPDAEVVHIVVETDGQNAKVVVKDLGVGLSQAQQEKIFTRFYRVEGAAPVSGLGLGLYLSKEIMERHKGKITVTSEVGMGSEFVIWLPL